MRIKLDPSTSTLGIGNLGGTDQQSGGVLRVGGEKVEGTGNSDAAKVSLSNDQFDYKGKADELEAIGSQFAEMKRLVTDAVKLTDYSALGSSDRDTQLAAIREQYNEMGSELAAEGVDVPEFDNAVAALEGQMANVEGQISTQNALFSAATDGIATSNQTLADSTTEILSSNDAITSLENTETQVAASSAAVGTSVTQVDSSINTRQADADNLNTDVNNLQATASSLGTDIQSHQDAAAAYDSTSYTANVNYWDAYNDKTTAQENVNNINTSIDSNNAALNDLQTRSVTLADRMSVQENIINSTTATSQEKADAQFTMGFLSSSMDSVESSMTAVSNNLNTLTTQRGQENANLATATNAMAEYDAQRSTMGQLAAAERSTASAKSSTLNSVESSIASKTTTLAVVNADVAALTSQRDALVALRDTFGSNLSSIRGQITAEQADIANATDAIAAANAAIVTYNTQKTDAVNTIDALNITLTDYQNQLAALPASEGGLSGLEEVTPDNLETTLEGLDDTKEMLAYFTRSYEAQAQQYNLKTESGSSSETEAGSASSTGDAVAPDKLVEVMEKAVEDVLDEAEYSGEQVAASLIETQIAANTEQTDETEETEETEEVEEAEKADDGQENLGLKSVQEKEDDETKMGGSLTGQKGTFSIKA